MDVSPSSCRTGSLKACPSNTGLILEVTDVQMGSDEKGTEENKMSDDQSIPWSASRPLDGIRLSAKALGKRKRRESQGNTCRHL